MKISLLVTSLLLGPLYAQANKCYITGENYLGIGSTFQLDSIVYLQSTGNRKTFYEYFPDSIITTFKRTDTATGIDSTVISITGIINGQVITFPSETGNDSVFISYYLGTNSRIDSIIVNNVISGQNIERIIFQYSQTERVVYDYYKGGRPYIDSTVYSDSGATVFVIDGSYTSTDTCISSVDSCICKNTKSVIENDHYVVRGNAIYYWNIRIGNGILIYRHRKSNKNINGFYYLINGKKISNSNLKYLKNIKHYIK